MNGKFDIFIILFLQTMIRQVKKQSKASSKNTLLEFQGRMELNESNSERPLGEIYESSSESVSKSISEGARQRIRERVRQKLNQNKKVEKNEEKKLEEKNSPAENNRRVLNWELSDEGSPSQLQNQDSSKSDGQENLSQSFDEGDLFGENKFNFLELIDQMESESESLSEKVISNAKKEDIHEGDFRFAFEEEKVDDFAVFNGSKSSIYLSIYGLGNEYSTLNEQTKQLHQKIKLILGKGRYPGQKEPEKTVSLIGKRAKIYYQLTKYFIPKFPGVKDKIIATYFKIKEPKNQLQTQKDQFGPSDIIIEDLVSDHYSQERQKVLEEKISDDIENWKQFEKNKKANQRNRLLSSFIKQIISEMTYGVPISVHSIGSRILNCSLKISSKIDGNNPEIKKKQLSNIIRRVYDCISILSQVGIVLKINRKEIYPSPTFLDKKYEQKCLNKFKNKIENLVKTQKQRNSELKKNLKALQMKSMQQLIENYLEKNFRQRFVQIERKPESFREEPQPHRGLPSKRQHMTKPEESPNFNQKEEEKADDARSQAKRPENKK